MIILCNIRTDMAYEAHKSAFDKNGGKIDGVIYEEYVHNTITAYKIEILNEKGEKATGGIEARHVWGAWELFVDKR